MANGGWRTNFWHGWSTKQQIVNKKSARDGLSPMLAAATNGHVEVVRCLLKNGAFINDTNQKGQTALIMAAKSGYLPLLRLLVNYGANLDIQDSKGRTALIYALMQGNLDMAKILIEMGASVRPADCDGKTALFVAAEGNHDVMVEILLGEAGVDISARDIQSRTVLMMLARASKAWSFCRCLDETRLARAINERDSSGWTPILHAVDAGKLAMAERLVRWGADPRAVTGDGQTVVMLACQRPDLHSASDADGGFWASDDAWDQKFFVSAMLNRGVPLEAVDVSGRSALFYAVENAQLEMVRHLLELEAQAGIKAATRDSSGNTILHAAVRKGRDSIVRYLLSLPEFFNLVEDPNADGEVPLRLAVMSTSLATLRILMESGASLQGADRCRQPPLLSIGSRYGAADIVDFLLDKGFHAECRDSDGVTPLMVAIRCDQTRIIESLAEASKNVNYINNQGFSALTLAVQTKNIQVCKLLLKRKADPNTLPIGKPDIKYPIAIAALLGDCAMVELLLKYNANPLLKDARGHNSLFYCVLMGITDSLKLLIRCAAPRDLDERLAHDGQMHTLLTLAAEKGQLEVTKVLLQSLASPNAKSSLGESPMHIACRRQNSAMVGLFISYNKNIDCPRDSDLLTPLMIACQQGNRDIAQVLCLTGANVNARTPDGYTALVLALSGSKNLMSCVPLVSELLARGAQFDRSIDEPLIGHEGWSLLMTLHGARTPQSPSEKRQQNRGLTTTKEPKTAGVTPVEKRQNTKPQNVRIQAASTGGQSKPPETKESLATRSKRIRDDMRIAADSTNKSLRRVTGMVNQHLERNALPDVSASKKECSSDISYLYDTTFALSPQQLAQNPLVKDFSTRMDQLRAEVLKKWEETLDALCQRNPTKTIETEWEAAEAKRSIIGSPLEALIKRQRGVKPKVSRRVLYQLKYDSKAAKESKMGLRLALMRRLSALSKKFTVRSRAFYRSRFQLPRFWENARLRRRITRHIFWKIFQPIADTKRASKDNLVHQYYPVSLQGMAIAFEEADAWWTPLPDLRLDDEKGGIIGPPRNAASHLSRSSAAVWRLLSRLNSNGNHSSLLLRSSALQSCGLKLSLTWEDQQRQIDLSFAIQPAPFRAAGRMPSRRPEVAVHLLVDTSRCLWSAHELHAFAKALEVKVKDKISLVESLERRRTYQFVTPMVSRKPQLLSDDLVVLHPLLSTKLLTLLLHARMAEHPDIPYELYGDDLVLYRQPGQKKLGQILGLLGSDRMRLVDTYRF